LILVVQLLYVSEGGQLLSCKGGRDYQNGGWLSLVITTGTVNVTKRDEMVCALEAVQYVLEARYNLISIGVLDEEEY